jgi:hypothetical protein
VARVIALAVAVGGKINISKFKKIVLVLLSSQLNCPQNDGITLSPHSSPVARSILLLLPHVKCFLLVVVSKI